MKQLLKPYVTNVLGLVDTFPSAMTGSDHIRSLLKQLNPKSTSTGLIRLGPKSDGGYLVPNDLKGIEACFSPGVSSVSKFEKECADLGMKVYLADKSVDRPTEEHELFHFTKKFVGVTSNDDFMTLDGWVNSQALENHSDLLLQIDIEGYEYEVFLSASEFLMQRFRIIVAEFHWFDQLWNRMFFTIAKRVFDKITQSHCCVHIHPNNYKGTVKRRGIELPEIMEFTFLRRDRVDHTSPQHVFPHPLDFNNYSNNPTIILPKCWYDN